jgi:hypothetical protein
MKIKEILAELTFHGSKCTKDCGGHSAGFAWGMQNKNQQSCNSSSPSFNKGCEIAADQKKTGVVRRPKIRDVRGRFAPKPMPRQAAKPRQPVSTTPIKPIKPQ